MSGNCADHDEPVTCYACPDCDTWACSCGCGREICELHGVWCEEHGFVARACAVPFVLDGYDLFHCVACQQQEAREAESVRIADENARIADGQIREAA